MRKCKLDELPQLLNVVWGDMSLVGPRPEVQKYVDLYTEKEKVLLQLRPGITDWASIWNSDEGAVLAGSDDPDRAYEELIRPTKLQLQLAYAHRHSPGIDLKIIWFTLLKLLRIDTLPAEVQSVLQAGEAARGETGKPVDPSPEYGSVTELPTHGATREQLSMMHTRYRLAARLSQGKDVLELACGPGIGLGCLAQTATRVEGGDYDGDLVKAAQDYYGDRVAVHQIDAQNLPFDDDSLDVILLLEAIYYLPDATQFVAEARRVLRSSGTVLVCSANCERHDFNASPFTHRYYSAAELQSLLNEQGFAVELFGGYATQSRSISGRVLGTLRAFAIRFNLIPKTMKWKILLKRLVFGKLDPIPPELVVDDSKCQEIVPLSAGKEVTNYKVIYAVGRRAA